MQSPTSYGLWLGATDNEAEGIWKWQSSGTVLNYFNWDITQPDNSRVENCLWMWKNAEKWDDWWCNNDGSISETLCEVLFECPFKN